MGDQLEGTGPPANSVEIRPMGVWDAFKTAVRIFWANKWVFFGIQAAFLAVPEFLLVFGYRYLILASLSDVEQTGGAYASDLLNGHWFTTAEVVAVLLLVAEYFVLQPIAAGVIIHAVNEFISGSQISLSGSLQAVKPRLKTVIQANALCLLIIGAFLGAGLYILFIMEMSYQIPAPLVLLPVYLLCVWTGLYLTIKWLFVLQAVVLDDKGPKDSLRRSFRLVSRYWWKTASKYFLLCLPISLVLVLALFGLDSIDGALIVPGQAPVTVIVLPTSIVYTALIIFLSPYITVVTSVLYYDLRARKEGH